MKAECAFYKDWGERVNWQLWFAWYPVTTLGGRNVWLIMVERSWRVEAGNYWMFDGYSGRDDGWVYRLPLFKNKEK